MKASLKFRDDRKPLARAKIPLSILGLPFLSGISAGDSKELALSLITAFDSGPSLKVSYHPNDSWNPFSIVVKTGISSFGSPNSAPLAMSAEFSVLGRGNPTFSLMFKPQIGDFSIKKKSGPSTIALPSKPAAFFPTVKVIGTDPEADVEVPIENGIYSGPDRKRSAPGFRSGAPVDRLLSGVEVTAKSILPLRSFAHLKFRWGVRIPDGLFTDEERYHHRADGISPWKAPLLVMNKISIEHVPDHGKLSEQSGASAGAEGSEACFSIRRKLDALQSESGLLRMGVEELRSEIGAGKGWGDGGWKPGAGKMNRRSSDSAPEAGGCADDTAENDAAKLSLKAGASAAGI